MSQADHLDHEFDTRGECDGSLTACAREGAGSWPHMAGCNNYCGEEAEGFELFFSFLAGSCGENGRGSIP